MRSLSLKLLSFREHPFLAGVTCWFLAQWLDIVSTLFDLAFVPGSSEGNPLMRDPITMKFMLFSALWVKGLVALVQLLPVSGFLYLGTRSAKIAAIPFYMSAFMLLAVCASNIAWIFKSMGF